MKQKPFTSDEERGGDHPGSYGDSAVDKGLVLAPEDREVVRLRETMGVGHVPLSELILKGLVGPQVSKP